MELVDEVPELYGDVSLGELAERWGEPAGRIADAIDAMKVVHGQVSYLPVVMDRGTLDP
jgi:hypothetical protein